MRSGCPESTVPLHCPLPVEYPSRLHCERDRDEGDSTDDRPPAGPSEEVGGGHRRLRGEEEPERWNHDRAHEEGRPLSARRRTEERTRAETRERWIPVLHE